VRSATVYAVAGGEHAIGNCRLYISWSLPVAFALSCPGLFMRLSVFATIAVVRRETNSVKSAALFLAFLLIQSGFIFAAWALSQNFSVA